MTLIPPEELIAYDNRRRRAKEGNQRQLAELEFGRGNTLQQQGLDTSSLAQQYDQMRRQLPGGYARRGLLNSGLYKQGLQQYGQQRSQASGDLAARYQQMLGQSEQNRLNLGTNLTNELGDIDDEERVRRSQIARALQGLPF